MKASSWIIFTILFSFVFVVGSTFYQANLEHQELSLLVVEKRIEEGAMHCYWDGFCESSKVTLRTLIEKGYAKEEVNPITKMYYSLDSYVEKNGTEYIFHEKL